VNFFLCRFDGFIFFHVICGVSNKSDIPKEIRFRESNKRSYQKRRTKELEWIMERLGKIKICSTCGFEGDISLFRNDYTINYDKPSKTQITGTCKECRRNKINKNNSCPEKKKRRAKREWDRVSSNPELLKRKKERSKIYHSQPRVKKMRSQYNLESRKKAPHLYRWRKLLWNAYKQNGETKPKNLKTIDALGYSSIELFNHLGIKPTPDSQIDHLVPLNWFISTTPPNITCDLRNLEWKTLSHNVSKSDRYADPILSDYYEVILQYIKDDYKNRLILM